MSSLPFHDEIMIIFTRYPVPGKTKTRMIPELGTEEAVALQRKMTEYTLAQARATGVPIEVRYTDGDADRMRAWLGDDVDCVDQGSGDLGERMERTFQQHFDSGARRVVIVGSDCPDNRADNIRSAFDQLRRTPCVIGPAHDGGYYLLGLNRPRPELLRKIDWGSEQVLEQTLDQAGGFALLPRLKDVDLPGDIPTRISVVIPALNEAVDIARCLLSVQQGFNTEAIMVDGGSTDNTAQIAAEHGALVIRCEPGRARQMNRGAECATGDILLFLHADSELPPDWDRKVRGLLECETAALGYFRFAIRERIAGAGWVEWSANLRSKILKRPYGDQALFLNRCTFERLGGYRAVPILEDLYLVKDAARLGRIRGVPAPVLTSGRRWIAHGILRTTIINHAVIIAAAAGTDLDDLHAAYRAGRNPLRHRCQPDLADGA